MNQAMMFSWWLAQNERSTLTQNDIDCLTTVDITTKLDPKDLLAVMYYGRGQTQCMALNSLKEKFEGEMHQMEMLTYPQGAEE
jgi:hypothetical protein